MEGPKILYFEHLTEGESGAESVWSHSLFAIKEAGRQDILQNPAVLDLGGGAGELSKYLNAQGIKCVSLDRQDWGTNPGANQIRGDAYQMPFADGSFNIVHCRGAFETLMYPHDFAKLFPEIARVLKARGVLSIQDRTPPPNEELAKYFKLLSSTEGYSFLWEKK